MDRSRGSYDRGDRGDGKTFKMGAGESYRPGGDPPRSPIGRADTFRSSDRDRERTRDRDRDRSPRRERARTPLRERERARTPIRERARTPIRDRARTPIRERARTPPTDRYKPPSRDRSPRRRSRSPAPFRRRERSSIRDTRDASTWRSRDRARTPPRRISPRRDSPRRGSPRRYSPRRGSSRRNSPRRASPRRISPRRDSPRRDSPRREEYRRELSQPRRELARDARARSRSPYNRDRIITRVRSPLPSRGSPPAAARGGWRRSRTPDTRTPFEGRPRPIGVSSLTWRRPRSPSPVPPPRSPVPRSPVPRDSQQTSGRNSDSVSRRSSPTIHPSRISTRQGSRPPSGTSSRAQSPINRDRSPSVRAPTYRDEDTDMEIPKEQSPVRAPRVSPIRRSPPRGPSAGYRPPPSGPSGGQRNFTAPAMSLSAHNRPENKTVPVVPAGPRGYQPPFRGRGRGSFPSGHRAENAWHNSATAGPTTSVSPTIPVSVPTTASAIPTGPRAANSHTILPERTSKWGSAPPRAPASVTSSFSRPALQRFDVAPSKPHIRSHPALASLPTIFPGGRKDPNASGISRELEARIKKNEEEGERLRDDLRVKEERIRAGLRTWERLERDSANARMRSELSEQQVRILSGEGVGGAF